MEVNLAAGRVFEKDGGVSLDAARVGSALENASSSGILPSDSRRESPFSTAAPQLVPVAL
jgi:hypothetical protein